MGRPAMSMYACIYAREFPAQALLRLRPNLRRNACAILEGEPPLQSVCSRNGRARRIGIEHGMTRVEVDTFPDVTVLRRSYPEEASARAALFDCAAIFSPSAEDRSSPTEFIAVLDITGTGRLHGPASTLARPLQERIRSAGIAASVVAAHNFHAAICLARGLHTTQRALVVPPEDVFAALAPLPVAVLEPTPDHAETFTTWGIHTLGDLAALPEPALIARMGQQGRMLRQLALGTHPHHFTPIEPAPTYTETIEFDAPVEQLESLLFVFGAMLDQLILRVSSRALAAASATVILTLESSGGVPARHTRAVRPALPVNDKHLWLKLIHLDLDAHPPGAPVLALTLTVEPGRTSKIQMGLFSPQLPDATRLDVALARVRALVGEDAIGSPVLSDTHRADSFQLQPLSITNTAPKNRSSAVDSRTNELSFRPERSGVEKPASVPATKAPLTQRQLRPAQEIFVTTKGHRPASFYFRQKKYEVIRAYGPWLSGGDWWNQTLWGVQQWDLVARSTEGALLCCYLHRDLMHNLWHMVALYD